jgi:hypothetical protein
VRRKPQILLLPYEYRFKSDPGPLLKNQTSTKRLAIASAVFFKGGDLFSHVSKVYRGLLVILSRILEFPLPISPATSIFYFVSAIPVSP